MRALWLLLFILAAHANSSAQQSTLQSDWEQFRRAYPYHIQAIALSERHGNGHHTLIISEPPPDLTTEDVTSLNADLASASTGRHSIGVDGWVKDLVVDVPPVDDARLAADVDRLHKKLFGTTYKAYVLSIPTAIDRRHLKYLDLHVGTADLASWLLQAKSGELLEPSVPSIPGLVISTLFLIWSMARLGNKKYVSAVILAALALIGLFMSSPKLAPIVISFACLAQCLVYAKRRESVAAIIFGIFSGSFLVLSGTLSSNTTAAKTTFSPLIGGKDVSCELLLKDKVSGVYISHPAGIVLWSLSKSKPIDSLRVEMRQFALDSDLILGAVGRDDQILVIGRERTTDVSLLPPLRAETISLLAGAKEDELAQSYERTNLFAGAAIDERGRSEDWAPILLSPRLIDTEYGSLLNITDQLLKGWSQHGEVTYVNFQYPKPNSYPFEKNLIDHLGVNEVTFNWNTKGAGYVRQLGPYEVYALNRTGALPIDYLAAGNSGIEKAEDEAYEWYSNLNDPNLIRVVNYAALYQIFHHFKVTSNVQTPSITQPFASMNGMAEEFLVKFANVSDDRLEGLKLHLNREGQNFVDTVVVRCRDILLQAATGRGELSVSQIASAAVDRSQERSLLSHLDNGAAKKYYFLFTNLSDVSELLMGREQRSEALFEYKSADTQHPGRWIRTPSVVESSADKGTGGHNLGAKVTLLEADGNVAVGKVTVTENGSGERVLHFNPADETRVNGAIRDAARNDEASSETISQSVEKRMAVSRDTPVDLDHGLGFVEGVRPDPRRGLQVSHISSGSSKFGWKPVGNTLSELDASTLKSLRKDSNQVLLLSRTSEGKYNIGSQDGNFIESWDQASAIEGLLELARTNPQKRVHLHMKGFDERQTEGFLSGTERYSDDLDIIATREEDLDLATVKSMIDGEYDLKKARFSEVSVSEADAAGYKTISQKIEIPAKSGRIGGIVIEIRARISALLANFQATVEGFGTHVKAILDGLSDERDLRFVTSEMVARLKKEGIYADVRAEAGKEGKAKFYGNKIDRQTSGAAKRLPV